MGRGVTAGGLGGVAVSVGRKTWLGEQQVAERRGLVSKPTGLPFVLVLPGQAQHWRFLSCCPFLASISLPFFRPRVVTSFFGCPHQLQFLSGHFRMAAREGSTFGPAVLHLLALMCPHSFSWPSGKMINRCGCSTPTSFLGPRSKCPGACGDRPDLHSCPPPNLRDPCPCSRGLPCYSLLETARGSSLFIGFRNRLPCICQCPI